MSDSVIQPFHGPGMKAIGFGHTYSQAGNTFIDCWGVGPFVIEYCGRSYRFEDSDMFGPVPLRKDGEVKEPGYFGEQNPFWYAWGLWVEQGRRTLADGVTCVWEHAADRREA